MDWGQIWDGAAYGALLGLAGGTLGVLVGSVLARFFPEPARKRVRQIAQVVFVVIAVALIPIAQKEIGPIFAPSAVQPSGDSHGS